jgi:preprotein translocase subunit SecF
VIDFLKYRYVCFFASLLLFGVGVVGYVKHGGFNYHIDFVGGTELQVTFDKALDSTELRAALSAEVWQDPIIQSIGTSGTQFLIKTKARGDEAEALFLDAAKDAIKDNSAHVDYISWVGSEVGSDISYDALFALFLSLFAVLLYVALRSQYRFGMGAVAALAHDVLAVVAVMLILNEQISLNILTALLTVVGYSINDTIVIFSRIQENLLSIKNKTEEEIINISINQTLRRTLLTSLTTFLAVLSFYLLGGEALKGFSLAMLVGIVAGTYSSIYIASPVMLAFGKREA